MIEFSDFYENYQASTETLQCPRCSASVPANPGVCGNCGENVYQCHKCRWAAAIIMQFWKNNCVIKVFQANKCVSRSINYDEKDPFLCNACGFCKYARFDFMLYAKPCCAVDPIENEEDRKKVHYCLKRNYKTVMWPDVTLMPVKTTCAFQKLSTYNFHNRKIFCNGYLQNI